MAIKTPERFDPFTDRTARNIRNSFSEAFVAALGAIDSGQYSHCLAFIANTETLLDKLKASDAVPPRLDFSSCHD